MLTERLAPGRPLLRAAGYGLVALGLLATLAMISFWGAAGIGRAVARALPALPGAIVVHALQLLLSALAWRALMPPPRLGVLRVGRLRWVREAVNSLLPLAGIGGGVAAGRLLAREAPMPGVVAAASVTADLTVEAAAQLPFLLGAIAATLLLAPARITPVQVALAILPLLLGIAGFVAAQRAGAARWIEHAASRLGAGRALEGLHTALMALHAQRGRVLRGFALHIVSWSLGGAEVWIVLRAIGHPVSPGAAFAMEGLGMAARSAGFVLPASLAAQEAGFVLAGIAFGVPPATAIALSMVKRLREFAVSLSGLLVWRFGVVPRA